MRRRTVKVFVACAWILIPLSFLGQETHSINTHHAEGEETHKRPLYFPEIEAVASSQFRTAFIVIPVWKKLAVDTRYYGNDEADVLLSGGGWEFEPWKGHLMLAPGLSVSYNHGIRTAPAATLRWDVRRSWFHAAGYSAISLIPSQRPHESEHHDERYSTYSYLSDGNHISANWKRLEGGFSWEHIAVREEQEWKSGGRFSIALTKHLNFVAFILAPETEFRCGLSFHPSEKE